MPVSSGSRPQSSTAARISATAATLSSDNQHVIAEIRKALSMMRSIAVDLEKQEQSDKVKELEAAVLELLDTYDDCTHFSEAIQTIGGNYQPSEQLTDFNKLLEDEIAKSKAVSPSVPQNNPFYRQFKEAIWVCRICCIMQFVLPSVDLVLFELIDSYGLLFHLCFSYIIDLKTVYTLVKRFISFMSCFFTISHLIFLLTYL
ncbi:E3 SUMO-protein ligase MMS21 isoform X2 [Musa acuminata AAA Group]|uniref:E3 SUMO-protein ligase MMS21 isoform X2 n=1 Tax=Musa acuminata AAA Group TaxID=214697 RepID=UPI0031E3D831